MRCSGRRRVPRPRADPGSDRLAGIVSLYDRLAGRVTHRFVELNRAVAISMAPEAGGGPRAALDKLAGEPLLAQYHLLPTVRSGDLLAKLGRSERSTRGGLPAGRRADSECTRTGLLLEQSGQGRQGIEGASLPLTSSSTARLSSRLRTLPIASARERRADLDGGEALRSCRGARWRRRGAPGFAVASRSPHRAPRRAAMGVSSAARHADDGHFSGRRRVARTRTASRSAG